MGCFDLVVVEGDLEVVIATRLLSDRGHPTPAELFVNKRGQVAFWADAPRLNRAARHLSILGLVDLERATCPSGLLRRKLPHGKSAGFVLRIAVRMSESWLLADKVQIASYLKIPEGKLPRNPETTDHPKRELVRLVQRYSPASIKDDMVPGPNRSSLTGPLYEERLAEFVRTLWNPSTAALRSDSLKRSLKSIDACLSA